MCGIIAYSGYRPAVSVLVEGLRSLEYRGYDSAGVGFMQAGELRVIKARGKLAALEEKLATENNLLATTGIGHTRWATHGVPVERNAHPHMGGEGRIALVHNGIIENYEALKTELPEARLLSETDTEVLAWYIAHEGAGGATPLEAFAAALRKARGAYAVAMVDHREPNVVYAARLSAPLVLGIGTGECFVASDVTAFLTYTKEVVFLDDGEIVRIEGERWEILSLETLQPVTKPIRHIPWDMQAAQKDGHKHFMLKEILEQPKVIQDCLTGRMQEGAGHTQVVLPELDALPVPKRLRIVACGTSYNAGLWSRKLMESMAGIPTEVEIASEFRYREPLLDKDELVLLISQSGETLDTLSALRLAKEKGCTTVGLCNVLGSSIAREADAVIYTQAGPEISVASTKAMSSQMLLLVLLVIYYTQRQGKPVDPQLLKSLEYLPNQLGDILPSLRERASQLARSYAGVHSFFYLGRGQAYPLALEGALKLKELSYIHAEGYAAGEIKHGPIALVDPDFPTFIIALGDELVPKLKSNMVEIQSRQGKVIGLVQTDPAGDDIAAWDVDDIWLLPPSHMVLSSFLALPALQLFSYEVADYLGKDVDQPRNLAKSVTVE